MEMTSNIGYWLVAFWLIIALFAMFELFRRSTSSWNRYWLLYTAMVLVLGVVHQFLFAAFGWRPFFSVIFLGVAMALSFFVAYKINSTSAGTVGPPISQEEMKGLTGTRSAIKLYIIVVALYFVLAGLIYLLVSAAF